MTETQPEQIEPPKQAKKQTFRCEICDRVFTSNAGLVIHKGRAHGPASNGGVIGSDPLDSKLLKVLFPDGTVPITKLADVQAWLEQGRKLKT